jgi:hypothetical protein
MRRAKNILTHFLNPDTSRYSDAAKKLLKAIEESGVDLALPKNHCEDIGRIGAAIVRATRYSSRCKQGWSRRGAPCDPWRMPRWCDHPWRFKAKDGATVFVAEPYDLGDEDLRSILELSGGWEIWISPGTGTYFPGHTIPVMFTRKASEKKKGREGHHGDRERRHDRLRHLRATDR